MTTLTAAGAVLWATGAQALSDGLTVVRVRGQYTLSLRVVTTIFDGFARWGMGICIVAENAFDAGVGSVPSPLSDIAWNGWMYHNLGGALTGFSTTETGRGPMEAVRVDIDTKAMRKTRSSDIVVGVLELGTEVGAATVGFAAETRMLVKLP